MLPASKLPTCKWLLVKDSFRWGTSLSKVLLKTTKLYGVHISLLEKS